MMAARFYLKVKQALLIILFCLVFIFGCAGYRLEKSETLPTVTQVQPKLDVTLFPLLDLRHFPDPEVFPSLENGVAILISASEISERAGVILSRQGRFFNIKSYSGPLPEVSGLKFPLRGLGTDAGLGLEIIRFDLKESGQNRLIVPQAVANAVLLPLFAVGTIISNGHFDLGGWMIPSRQVEYLVKIKANFFSLKGGGLIFSKTYQVIDSYESVPDRKLKKGFFQSKEDGQEMGRLLAPGLIQAAFTRVAEDRELSYLPSYIQLTWLGRIMEDDRLRPAAKAALLDRLFKDAILETSISEEISTDDDKPGIPGHEKGESKAKYYDQNARTLLKLAGRMNREKMQRTLAREEITQFDTIMKILGWLGQQAGPNELYRSHLGSPEVSLYEKKAIVLLLARDLESFDNEGFLQELSQSLAKDLKGDSPEKRLEAAALLIALDGEEAIKRYDVSTETALKALSSDDVWVEAVVLKMIEEGDFQPEAVRLAGALNMSKAGLILLAALEKTLNPDQGLSGKKEGEGSASQVRFKEADPVLIVKALGNIKDQPLINTVLRSLLEYALAHKHEFSGRADLPAEIIRSLGRLQDRDSVESFFQAWVQPWPGVKNAHLIRRAALESIALMGDDRLWGRILAQAQALDLDLSENQAILREAGDFFGLIRYAPAVPLMVKIINHPQSSDLMLKACFQALSRMAAPEAETALYQLVHGPIWHLSKSAEEALEQLVLEKALILSLKEL